MNFKILKIASEFSYLSGGIGNNKYNLPSNLVNLGCQVTVISEYSLLIDYYEGS